MDCPEGVTANLRTILILLPLPLLVKGEAGGFFRPRPPGWGLVILTLSGRLRAAPSRHRRPAPEPAGETGVDFIKLPRPAGETRGWGTDNSPLSTHDLAPPMGVAACRWHASSDRPNRQVRRWQRVALTERASLNGGSQRGRCAPVGRAQRPTEPAGETGVGTPFPCPTAVADAKGRRALWAVGQGQLVGKSLWDFVPGGEPPARVPHREKSHRDFSRPSCAVSSGTQGRGTPSHTLQAF